MTKTVHDKVIMKYNFYESGFTWTLFLKTIFCTHDGNKPTTVLPILSLSTVCATTTSGTRSPPNGSRQPVTTKAPPNVFYPFVETVSTLTVYNQSVATVSPPNVYNQPMATVPAPNVYNQPMATVYPPNVNNQPVATVSSPNVYNQPMATVPTTNIHNQPMATVSPPNVDNQPVSTVSLPNVYNQQMATVPPPNVYNQPMATVPPTNVHNQPAATVYPPNFYHQPVTTVYPPSVYHQPVATVSPPNIYNQPVATVYPPNVYSQPVSTVSPPNNYNQPMATVPPPNLYNQPVATSFNSVPVTTWSVYKRWQSSSIIPPSYSTTARTSNPSSTQKLDSWYSNDKDTTFQKTTTVKQLQTSRKSNRDKTTTSTSADSVKDELLTWVIVGSIVPVAIFTIVVVAFLIICRRYISIRSSRNIENQAEKTSQRQQEEEQGDHYDYLQGDLECFDEINEDGINKEMRYTGIQEVKKQDGDNYTKLNNVQKRKLNDYIDFQNINMHVCPSVDNGHDYLHLQNVKERSVTVVDTGHDYLDFSSVVDDNIKASNASSRKLPSVPVDDHETPDAVISYNNLSYFNYTGNVLDNDEISIDV